MNITDAFIEKVNLIAQQQIASNTLHQVKRCLLDYLGVLFAGRCKLGDKLHEIEAMGKDDNCSVIATGNKKDLYTAAMMNGFAAHVLELDDGHRIGAPHLEAVIISAMMGIAQKEQINFEHFVKGILIGYETTIRLSAAMQPSLKEKGFHSTGVCGAIGVALAVGYSIDFNNDQIKNAVSAAATSAAGILQVLDDNSELKPYNVANAILSGLTSVNFARCGFRGPGDVLGGRRGYLRAHSDEVNMEYLLGGGNEPAIFQIYVKPYASCRHSHPAVECALGIRGKHALLTGEIDDIEVQTYRIGITAHDHTEISSVSAAKMSTPYSVAASLVFGSCGMEVFSEEAIARQDIQELTRKVRVVENERLTRACPAKRGAIVNIKMKDGQIFSEEVEYPLGEPENKITDSQLEAKFESLMSFAGESKDKIDYLKSCVWNLEDNFDEFMTTI